MQTKLSRVVIALVVVGALVGAVGVVSGEMDTNETDAPMHNDGDLAGHMADGITAMSEMAHMGEYMNGSMTEHMNDHEPGEHHDRDHRGGGHGHC